MWVLMLRDRHNGNLMLDSEGHYFHIDFGFVLGHSTGKQIGGLVECSPFKLTAEYVELLDGEGSPVYQKFCDACVAGTHYYDVFIGHYYSLLHRLIILMCFYMLR